MISLVITVLNERENLAEWLDSILRQTRTPDEIIIVDGGSADGTWEWLGERAKNESRLKIFQRPGNIASGRNYAIGLARAEVIVVTDAGCIYNSDWLDKLTAPVIAKEADFATTAFAPWLKPRDSWLKFAVAAATIPARHEFKKNWLPSSRSVAFKKELWHTQGGYPEWIPYCEDVLFDLNLRKNGVIFHYIREPLVYWRPRNNLRAYFKQLYNYTRSEGHALLNTHRQFIRYFVYFLALVMIVAGASGLYNLLALLWIGVLVYMNKFDTRFGEFAAGKSYGFKFGGILALPFIVAVGDAAKMCGWPVGIYERLTKSRL